MKPINGIRFPSNEPPGANLSNYAADSSAKQLKNSSRLCCNASQLSQASSKGGSLRTSIMRTPSQPFRQDTKYSIFTTAQEQSNKVVVSETPISAKIINDKLAEVSQLNSFL